MTEELARSGIPGLDYLIGGGFPTRRIYLVHGRTGSGKTTVGMQFAREGARNGETTLYVALAESAAELSQILIDNADQFSDEGSTVTIEAKVEGSRVAVAVRDNGIGIAPDKLESIFHLFAQASEPSKPSRGGLGIGLTVVQALVEMNGGSISVSSKGPGTGTEFVVRLPLADTEEGRPCKMEAAGRNVPAAPKRLLLIEDDPDGALTLKALPETDRHEVTVCSDGRDYRKPTWGRTS